jgi:hypothetical protein
MNCGLPLLYIQPAYGTSICLDSGRSLSESVYVFKGEAALSLEMLNTDVGGNYGLTQEMTCSRIFPCNLSRHCASQR